MSKPENPSAFPLPALTLFDGRGHPTHPGMSLRDWFAGQALPQAIEIGRSGAKPDADVARLTAAIAGIAYDFADEMLAERERQP